MSSSAEETAIAHLTTARSLKDAGNDLFKQESFGKARVKYATALAYTKGLPGRSASAAGAALDPMAGLAASSSGAKLSEALESEITALEAVLKTNIAACYLKTNNKTNNSKALTNGANSSSSSKEESNADKALRAAEEATRLQPSYAKAWLRKAEAHLASRARDTDKAAHALREAERLAQGERSLLASIARLQEAVRREERTQQQRQAKAFGNIFARMNNDKES